MNRRRLTAVDLDALLATWGPELAAQVEAHTPAGLADQVHAALRASIAAVEAGQDTPVVGVAPHTVDDWIRLGALDTLVGWIGGSGKTCLHQPHWRRPQPVWSAAWRPGLVVCSNCLHLLQVVGDADRTCDCCGRVCAGDDAGDPIYTTIVWCGALAYQCGTCADCRPDLGEAAS
jgi:hypothetical protein